MAPPSPGTAAHGRFRRDVEGLRAIAVLLVLGYHGGLSVLPGGFVGVDVFFVVSGFVITSQLLREVEISGTVDLPRFYGRRAKRLLPAATVVLLVTAISAWLLAPRTQWSTISGDVMGASLYVVNWVFVGRSVDYLAEDIQPSPVLHFWSLAIEEQFYIIWPLLILGLLWFVNRTSRGHHRNAPRAPLAIGLVAVVVLPSLLWSFSSTATAPAQAFFATTTRLWELGIGALVALGAGAWARGPRAAGNAVGWAGVVLILFAAFGFSDDTSWPGTAALVPTIGAALVIVGGFTAGARGPRVVLGSRNAVWIGGLSYSLYLWHWPLLRMAEWQWGELSTLAGMVIVTASVLPAWLSYRYVERPLRYAPVLNRRPGPALFLGASVTMLSLAGALVLGQAAPVPTEAAASSGGSRTGELRGDEEPSPDAPASSQDERSDRPASPTPAPLPADGAPLYDVITPDPLAAVTDLPDLYATGCQVGAAEGVVTACAAGDPDGRRLVYVVGDSKIGQWMPALDEIAQANDWRLILHTKDSCAFADVTVAVDEAPFDQCREWGRQVMSEMDQERPDAVIVGSVRKEAFADDGTITSDALVEGYESYWSQLTERGVAVVALSDNPQPNSLGMPVYECVDEHRDDPVRECSWDAGDGSGSEAMQQAAQGVDGAAYVDMNPWVCPDGRCSGVWRNVLTYRQGSHLTRTFVLALAEPLAIQLVPMVGE